MSRGFVCALFGIAMTLFSWYGPWAWPAWPAFALIHIVFGAGGSYHELGFAGRSAVIVVLVAVNVAAWAVAAYVVWVSAAAIAARSDSAFRR